MLGEELLPPYTPVERSRELCHISKALRKRALKICNQSKALQNRLAQMCNGLHSACQSGKSSLREVHTE